MSTRSDQAREYIQIFSKHTMPGARYVCFEDSPTIYFNNMTDEQAIKVADCLMDIEAEAAKRATKQ